MNPWKLTSIALVLVMATAVVTGIVVANWSGKAAEAPVAEVTPAPAASAKRMVAAAPAPVQ
ncbi:MAG: hypothetical protein FJ027_12995, partial [Candidatus Rokubacteria bacterium]|nr:hypothetical protein [Candidatus Rokubacteria bacterium]